MATQYPCEDNQNAHRTTRFGHSQQTSNKFSNCNGLMIFTLQWHVADSNVAPILNLMSESFIFCVSSTSFALKLLTWRSYNSFHALASQLSRLSHIITVMFKLPNLPVILLLWKTRASTSSPSCQIASSSKIPGTESSVEKRHMAIQKTILIDSKNCPAWSRLPSSITSIWRQIS